jgi:hypothetical protein
MKGFALAAVTGSLRQVLAIVIAVASIAGTAYLVTHKLSNPDNYRYGGCYHAFVTQEPLPCRHPTRTAWQIPLAVVVAIGGLGAAVLVTSRRPWRRAGGSEERRVLRV